VKPKGWMKHQLDLMADGLVGQLSKLSEYVSKTNGWFGTDEQASHFPYYLWDNRESGIMQVWIKYEKEERLYSI
jgi:hypothetical protein